MLALCPHCKNSIDMTGFSGDFICPHCRNFVANASPPQAQLPVVNTPPTIWITARYPNLRRIIGWLVMIAWVNLIIGLLIGVGIIVMSVKTTAKVENEMDRLSMITTVGVGFAIVFAAVTVFVVVMAIAEFLALSIDVEENTRVTSKLLEQRG